MEKKGQVLSERVLRLGSTSAWRFQIYETLGSHLALAPTLLEFPYFIEEELEAYGGHQIYKIGKRS